MLVNADLSEQPLLGVFVHQGSWGDFNQPFFQTTAVTMVSTMFIGSYYNINYFAMTWLQKKCFWRCYDRGCGCNKKKTKKISIKQYTDLYDGWDFCIHFRYAGILNVVFTTFMYGYGIPLLFPIAALTFFSYYMQEIAMLFYFYKEPPKFDKTVSDLVIRTCMYAPLFYLAFGYWMASNRQLLSNDYLEAREYSVSTKHTGHNLYRWLTPKYWLEEIQGPAWPLLALFVFLLCFQILLKDWCGKKLRGCSKWVADGVDECRVEEDLCNYWRTLDVVDRQWTIKEEEHGREVFGKVLTTESFERAKSFDRQVRTESRGDSHKLQGVHSYDILANPLYYEAFAYIPVFVKNRDKLIIDSESEDDAKINKSTQCDLTRLALNLGFLEPDSIKDFKFSKKGMLDVTEDHASTARGEEETPRKLIDS